MRSYFTAAGLCMILTGVLSGGESVIDFAAGKNYKLSAQVAEKTVPPPDGFSMKKTENGLAVSGFFPTDKHDAVMVEFPVNVPKCTRVSLEMTVAQAGHRPFIVVTDAGGENHYFSLIETNSIPGQAIASAGRHTFTVGLPLKNASPGEYTAARWGGDDNQKIDFPLKKVMIGLNDYPDSFKGKASFILHKLRFF